MAELARRGYRGVTFSDAVRDPGARGTVAITFDDAYRSVSAHAQPVLARVGFPATVFVPTDFVDAGQALRWAGVDHWADGAHAGELTPLSWPELGELGAAGWEIGSHTRSHPRLTTLSDAAIEDELAGSKAACERALGAACVSLAYPYGDVDQRVVALAARAGYETAGTLPATLRPGGPLLWPRVGVYHADDDRRFATKISPLSLRVRSSPAAQPLVNLWRAAGRARASLRD